MKAIRLSASVGVPKNTVMSFAATEPWEGDNNISEITVGYANGPGYDTLVRLVILRVSNEEYNVPGFSKQVWGLNFTGTLQDLFDKVRDLFQILEDNSAEDAEEEEACDCSLCQSPVMSIFDSALLGKIPMEEAISRIRDLSKS